MTVLSMLGLVWGLGKHDAKLLPGLLIGSAFMKN
jgi:hypothetical protein